MQTEHAESRASSASERQRNRNQHWGSKAADYDRTFKPIESQLYVELEAQIVAEFLQPAPGMTILDVCSGTGRNSRPLAKAGARVIGLDAARGMVEFARQKALEAGLDNLTFLNGSALELPFPDDSFDAVTGTRFMYMMTPREKRQIVSEMTRVLKPGGVLALQFNCGFWGVKHELANLLKRRPARLRSRYLWPGQIHQLMAPLHVEKLVGVKLPWVAKVSKLTGSRMALGINRVVRLPGFRFASAYLVVKAVKSA